MKQIYFADFETTQFKDNPTESYQLERILLVIKKLNHPTFEIFHFPEDNEKSKLFFQKISNYKNPATIYFHNSLFDYQFLYNLLPERLDYDFIFANSKPLSIKGFRNEFDKQKNRMRRKTYIEIRDSMALLQTSIEKLGELLGFPKLKMSKNKDELVVYCQRDVEIMERTFVLFLQTINLVLGLEIKPSQINLTTAGLGKKCWKYFLHEHYPTIDFGTIFHVFTPQQENELRAYYFGGRVEVFNFNLQTNVNYNDFNSFYASIMAENEFPLAPYYFRKKGNFLDIDDCLETDSFVGAFCLVEENIPIPLIPSRYQNKVFYLNGLKSCFLFREEMQYLLQLHQPIELIESIFCIEWIHPFKDFMELLYQKRKENDIYDRFLKWLMNGVYGKYAEKSLKEKFVIHDELPCDAKDFQFIYNERLQQFLERYSHHIFIENNILWGMRIPALTRLKLHKYLCNDFNLAYCDSDSIVSNTYYPHSEILGELKSEFTADKFQALSCKEYIYQSGDELRVKMKGFRSKTKVTSFQEFIKSYFHYALEPRLIGIKESYHRNIPLGTMLVIHKQKQHIYDKRFICDDLTTLPFHIDDNYDHLVKNNYKMIETIIQNT